MNLTTACLLPYTTHGDIAQCFRQGGHDGPCGNSQEATARLAEAAWDEGYEAGLRPGKHPRPNPYRSTAP